MTILYVPALFQFSDLIENKSVKMYRDLDILKKAHNLFVADICIFC